MGIDFEVDGKRARSASEYEAFLRDKKKIDAIKKNILYFIFICDIICLFHMVNYSK